MCVAGVGATGQAQVGPPCTCRIVGSGRLARTRRRQHERLDRPGRALHHQLLARSPRAPPRDPGVARPGSAAAARGPARSRRRRGRCSRSASSAPPPARRARPAASAEGSASVSTSVCTMPSSVDPVGHLAAVVGHHRQPLVVAARLAGEAVEPAGQRGAGAVAGVTRQIREGSCERGGLAVEARRRPACRRRRTRSAAPGRAASSAGVRGRCQLDHVHLLVGRQVAASRSPRSARKPIERPSGCGRTFDADQSPLVSRRARPDSDDQMHVAGMVEQPFAVHPPVEPAQHAHGRGCRALPLAVQHVRLVVGRDHGQRAAVGHPLGLGHAALERRSARAARRRPAAAAASARRSSSSRSDRNASVAAVRREAGPAVRPLAVGQPPRRGRRRTAPATGCCGPSPATTVRSQ